MKKILGLAFLFCCINASAQTKPPSFKICQNNATGAIRIAQNKKCKAATETTISNISQLVGAAGATGATGATGIGIVNATLPSGTVLKGAVGLDHEEPSGGGDWKAIASLPVPVSVLTSDDVILANTAEVDNDCSGAACILASELALSGNCTGTAEAPTAPAGKLCIYISSAGSNITQNTIFADPLSGLGTTTQTTGFQLRWIAGNTGDSYIQATWAYTAP